MTSKEKAQDLWGTVMDRTRSSAEHRAALDELLLLKKEKKTSLDKLGVPQVMWDREDAANRKNAELAADLKDDFVMSDEELALQNRPKKDEEEPKPLISEHHLKVAANLGKVPGPTPTELKSHAPDPAVAATSAGEDLTPEVAAASQANADERGQISKTVRHMLLNTSHPYAKMVDLIRAKHPSARTTARSIASVASDMRRAGFAVLERLKDAK